MAQADTFVLFDAVQWERHSWENRCHIKTQNGAQLLTVPVESKAHFEKRGIINVVRGNWGRKHLRAIELAYKSTKWFDDLFPQLQLILRIFSREGGTLSDLNYEILINCAILLGIKTPIVRATHYAFRGEKSDLVLDMCKQLGAKKYIFGSQGRDYADREAFVAAGIDIEFQDYKPVPYRQLHGAFVPDMSTLDLLFNEGPASRDILLAGNAD